MPNFRFTLEYDGRDFAGWQVQAQGQRTVQGELCRAIAAATGPPGELVLPDSDRLENELVTFLRNRYPTNNVCMVRLVGTYADPAAFPGPCSGVMSHDWPDYRGAIEEGPELAAAG